MPKEGSVSIVNSECVVQTRGLFIFVLEMMFMTLTVGLMQMRLYLSSLQPLLMSYSPHLFICMMQSLTTLAVIVCS